MTSIQGGDLAKVHDQHLHADERDDQREPVVEQVKAPGHVGEQKVHCPKAEDRKNARREDDEL